MVSLHLQRRQNTRLDKALNIFFSRRRGLCSPLTQAATVALSFRWYPAEAAACWHSRCPVPRLWLTLHDAVVALSVLCCRETTYLQTSYRWARAHLTRAPRGTTLWRTFYVQVEALARQAKLIVQRQHDGSGT